MLKKSRSRPRHRPRRCFSWQKITTADLAGKMQFWAHMGHPCGESFIGEQFYKLHPEYEWQSKYLKNMIAYPWTLFSAKQ